MAQNLSAGARAVRAAGGITLSKFREVQKSEGFTSLAKQYAEGRGISEQAAKASTSRFTREYLRAHFKNGKWREQRGDSLRGPLHRILVAAGKRDPNATHQPGKTPDKKKR